MTLNKVSNLIKENYLLDTQSFNNLSPLMKEAINDVLKLVKNDGNLIFNFENAVDKVAEFHNVNKKEIEEYFDKETKEQLGV